MMILALVLRTVSIKSLTRHEAYILQLWQPRARRNGISSRRSESDHEPR